MAAVSPEKRKGDANFIFGAYLDKNLSAIIKRELGSGATPKQIFDLTTALNKELRASVGQHLGVQGGAQAGGVGGSAGSGVDLKIGAGAPASLAGGASGKISGVATGGASLGASLGTKVAPGAGLGVGAKAGAGAGVAVKAGMGLKISASVMVGLGDSLRSAGFAPSEVRDLSSQLQPAVNNSVQKPINSANSEDLSYSHADGVPILGFRITMQERGKWTAVFKLDSEDSESKAPSGPFVANIGGIEFRCTVVPDRYGTWGGAHKIKVVGGAGGLDVEYGARNYAQGLVRFQTVFTDILVDSGESQSLECDQSVLNTQLEGWQRSRGSAAQSLNALCDKVGCQWRVLRDGTIWVGIDQWPEIEPAGDVMYELHDDGVVKFSTDTPALVPGIFVHGKKIKKVIHQIDDMDPNASLRSECHALSERNLFEKILENANRKSEYGFRYTATVTRDNSDGTVDVMVDDERMKGRGVAKCRVMTGIPNATFDIKKGSRCLVGWTDGDPSLPYASDWGRGSKGVIHVGDGGRGGAFVGSTCTVILPALMPINGALNGAPFTGVMTVIDQGIAIINDGSELITY